MLLTSLWNTETFVVTTRPTKVESKMEGMDSNEKRHTASSAHSATGSTASQTRILHFSDGTMEVPEVEQDVADHQLMSQPIQDPKQLDWGPWALHMTAQAGSKTLEVCDFLGEGLASFFGITTPKYSFEINEYHRMKKAEEEAEKEKDLELGSWGKKEEAINGSAVLSPPVTTVASAPPIKY